MSDRCNRFAEMVNKTGIVARVRDDLRKDLWLKIMGNSAFNPTGALTLATVGEMINDPEVEAQLRLIMEEVTAVGRALGAEPSETADYRIENSRKNAMPHKSSMLQDLERGRMMEVNQIIGAARGMGRLVGVPTPTIDTVFRIDPTARTHWRHAAGVGALTSWCTCRTMSARSLPLPSTSSG